MKGFMAVILIVLGAIYGNAQLFTYQGFLQEGGDLANGSYNLAFKLFNAASGGAQVGSTLTMDGTGVANGLFTVELNFGATAFPGADRWLEIVVNGTTLVPRVKINATPYSIFSQNTRGISVDGSGNVGVGTTTPTSSLHIAAPIPVLTLQDSDSSSQQVGYISLRDNTGAERGYIGYGSTATPHAYFVNNRAGGNIILGTAGGNPRLTVASGGFVGVGTTAPLAKLHVTGNANVLALEGANHAYIEFYPQGVAAGRKAYFGYPSAGSNTLSLQNDAAGGNILIATFASNVGIGIQTPLAKLDVQAFDTSSGVAVRGELTTGSGTAYGVYGKSASTIGHGVGGYNSATTGTTRGVIGRSDSTTGQAVYGFAFSSSGTNFGVYGETRSSSGYGVFSNGRFAATGTKSFRIDHPLMPETHYLNHFCMEGPEPYNLYRGTVMLDERGEAWVQLPDYFGEINRDPSYHLTPIGAPMSNLYVAVEIQNNRFKIAGGAPSKKVSWEVKAVRNDRWVQEYGFQTEPEKEDDTKGKYLNPELFGQPKEKGINYSPEPGKPEK
jgi:hypothetical protein